MEITKQDRRSRPFAPPSDGLRTRWQWWHWIPTPPAGRVSTPAETESAARCVPRTHHLCESRQTLDSEARGGHRNAGEPDGRHRHESHAALHRAPGFRGGAHYTYADLPEGETDPDLVKSKT